MKQIIVSDLHGNKDVLDFLIESVFPNGDEIWWMGDLFHVYRPTEKTLKESREVLTTLYNYKEKPVTFIKGNCDYLALYSDFNPRFEIKPVVKKTIHDLTILLTHGHLYETPHDFLNLLEKNKASILVYGHTHLYDMRVLDKAILINPGSPSIPRNDKQLATYITFDADLRQFTLHELYSGDTIQKLFF